MTVKRKPTFFEAILPIIALFLLLSVGYGIFRLKVEVLLVLSAVFASFIALRVGVSWDEMMEGITEKVDKGLSTMLILVIVGVIISSMMMSGTLPMLIYYGIQIINPRFLYVSAFLICAVVSTCTGTSWGSMGTMGVVMITIAEGLGLSLPITAGAVVSGAYFGDKMSPLSDTTVMAPMVAGADLYDHIRHMFYTTIPSAIAAVLVYGILGFCTSTASLADSEVVTAMLETLDSIYNWNIILLLPLLLVLAGSLLKKPTIPVMVVSCITALLLGVYYQGFSVKNAFLATYGGFQVSMVTKNGFDVSQVIPEIQTLLNRGGMTSMLSTVLLILCAFCFAGIITKAGCLDVILEKLMKLVKTSGQLIAATAASCIFMALTTCSGSMVLLIPGEIFADIYRKKGYAARNLSRTLEDSGTVVVPLVPWSVAGAYTTGVLGVATMAYLPWAVFNYSCVLFALICGFTGIGIMTLEQENAIKKKK